jgi:hypothetical protein
MHRALDRRKGSLLSSQRHTVVPPLEVEQDPIHPIKTKNLRRNPTRFIVSIELSMISNKKEAGNMSPTWEMARLPTLHLWLYLLEPSASTAVFRKKETQMHLTHRANVGLEYTMRLSKIRHARPDSIAFQCMPMILKVLLTSTTMS